jgi:hypothetical protein
MNMGATVLIRFLRKGSSHTHCRQTGGDTPPTLLPSEIAYSQTIHATPHTRRKTVYYLYARTRYVTSTRPNRQLYTLSIIFKSTSMLSLSNHMLAPPLHDTYVRNVNRTKATHTPRCVPGRTSPLGYIAIVFPGTVRCRRGVWYFAASVRSFYHLPKTVRLTAYPRPASSFYFPFPLYYFAPLTDDSYPLCLIPFVIF